MLFFKTHCFIGFFLSNTVCYRKMRKYKYAFTLILFLNASLGLIQLELAFQ